MRTTRRPRLALLVIGAIACGGALAPAALAQPGTTVITHGFQLDGNFPGWPAVMGTAIAQLGTPQGTVLVQDPASGVWSPVFGSEDPAGEIILCFDWAESSSWEPGDDEKIGTARAAADALYAALRDPRLAGGLAGTNLLESAPGVARPLHFIGHSRGTTVNSDAVRRLVVAGIDVDHVTALDPHPIGPSAGLLDPVPTTWEGVAFADTYWRADGCDIDYGCLGFDFDGETVPGSYNVDLGLDAFGGFDNRLSSCTLEHILVHTWYHGTIDLAVGNDGGCAIDRSSDWYVAAGAMEGHFLSAAGGGAASRPCGPTGGCPDAGRTVATPAPSIVNGDLEFGAGHAAGWRWQGGGGGGQIISEPGNTFLSLANGAATRTHNDFFLPTAANAIDFSARVFVAEPGAVLEVIVDDPEAGLETTIDTVPLDATTGWVTRTGSLAGVATGETVRLRMQLVPNNSTAIVDLDDFVIVESTSVPEFRRGDCNADDQENLADAIFALGAIFGIGAQPVCVSACDANDDGGFDISDPVTILGVLFGGGAPLPPPNPGCGPDPTPDGLGCVVPPVCP